MLIIMIRSVILYVIIIAAIRFMGKKQLGELQPSELVTTILISNIATMSIEDPSLPMLIGIVPIVMIVCIDVLMSLIMLKSSSFRKAVTGSPKVIISNGVIDQKTLEDLRLTIDDILESMREQGIFDISDVRYAIVETTGKINFFKCSDGASDPPTVLIKDGLKIKDSMKRSGISDSELSDILKSRCLSEKDVFLLAAARGGNYIIIKKQRGREA